MTTGIYAVTQAAGLPETRLPYEFLAHLPTSAARAPWSTTCDVISWMHPIGDSALPLVPAAIRPAKLALVVWALVRYSDTPVGPYSEIAATVVPDGGDGYGHIPFIVVDSLASIVGGRANWLLPKALARFEWSSADTSAGAVSIVGEQPATPAWSINVQFSTSGEASELRLDNHVEQVTNDGGVHRFDGEMTGQMTAASVDVTGHADGPLAALLHPGTYDGTSLTGCHFEVGALTDV
jgi:Acetoacetate decarboxylase (ADC)